MQVQLNYALMSCILLDKLIWLDQKVLGHREVKAQVLYSLYNQKTVMLSDAMKTDCFIQTWLLYLFKLNQTTSRMVSALASSLQLPRGLQQIGIMFFNLRSPLTFMKCNLLQHSKFCHNWAFSTFNVFFFFSVFPYFHVAPTRSQAA